MPDRKHEVSIIVGDKQIFGWEEYEFGSSLLAPTSTFNLQREWSAEVWNLLPRDSPVRIAIDSTVVVDGFIEDRGKRARAHTIVIEGADRASRLVQESAPRIDYNGLETSEAIRRLADPWVPTIALSDARNRRLILGKGYKITKGNEPAFIHKVVQRGQAHPGQSRWSMIEEIVSANGMMAWVSADGKELFIGKPNQTQPAQYQIILAAVGGSRTTVIDLNYDESNGDRFSLIAVVGNGGGTETDFGETVSSRRAFVVDNEFNLTDGTGRDFQFPKRLMMPETHFDSNDDASLVAGREQLRRDFRRTHVTATMPYHGQWIDSVTPTIFGPNTIARVRDEEMDPMLDANFFVYACRYKGSRDIGETTELQLVPQGTEIVQ